MVQMYKPAYTHLMNPAWMSTFLFLAPAKKKKMQKNSDVSMGKRNNNQTTEIFK